MEKKTSETVIKDWRQELLGYLEQIREFPQLNEPSEILRLLSGFSARARYMNNALAASSNRVLENFKKDEVASFLNETEFQFRCWSRIAAIQATEWEMSKG